MRKLWFVSFLTLCLAACSTNEAPEAQLPLETSAAVCSRPALGRGSRGGHVKYAEQRLLTKGNPYTRGTPAYYIRTSGGANDYFGTGTHKAVIAFKNSAFGKRSSWDSNIGPLTWEKLGCSTLRSAAFRTTSTYGEAPLTVKFTASDSRGKTYAWDPDTCLNRYYCPLKIEGRTISHRYSAPGNYNVTLHVKGYDGEDYKAVTKVIVRRKGSHPPSNKLPTPSFSVKRSRSGLYFDASASRDPDGQIRKYTWYLNGKVAGHGKSLRFGGLILNEATLIVTDNEGRVSSTRMTFECSGYCWYPSIPIEP